MDERIARNLHRSRVTIAFAIATVSLRRKKTMSIGNCSPRILAVVLASLLAATGTSALAQKKDTPEVLLQRAIQKEMVDGDLKAAIDLYKKVIAASGVSPKVAADALVRMGQAYERTGDAEAKKAYERVVREFPSQTEAFTQAKRRLSALGKPQPSGTIIARLICPECGDTEGSITADGR